MLLIADCGATKSSWRLLDNSGHVEGFRTGGYNPFFCGEGSLRDIVPAGFNRDGISKVAFYCAGLTDLNIHYIYKELRLLFSSAEIYVAPDMLGAARAVCGDRAGFVGILGTGSNSCLYDGRDITFQIKPLGFILGDEGSGSYMGKRLAIDYLRGYMPEDVRRMFREEYPFSYGELMEQICTKPAPNRFCASLTRFLTGKCSGNEYLGEHIIGDSFRDFFRNIVCHYPCYKDYKFNCVGSVGWIFRDRLRQVAQEFGMETGVILADPADGLAEYYGSE